MLRLLPDDVEGDRHQRIIVRLRNHHTLLIAHNIDLAKRIPLGIGDRIRFRGIYEWNDLGGLVHWTHDDPHGIELGGWIQFRRENYR